jgi:uncharacterized protein YlaI
MLPVYVCDEAVDRVAVVTIQDARSARAPTSTKRPTEIWPPPAEPRAS